MISEAGLTMTMYAARTEIHHRRGPCPTRVLGSHSRDQHRRPAHATPPSKSARALRARLLVVRCTLRASAYRRQVRRRPARGMQYLSLMIGSSDMPLDASSAESGRTADAPGALPRLPTSFVGREHELADARRLLAHSRLLTLTGPGGCGKTRLSIELAAGVADEYPDGVHFVSLAGITDPALVPRSIAQGVGLQDSRGRPLLEHLSSYVRDRKLLLVLDNFEHLLPAGGFVAELRNASTQLRILVTSRSPLHCRASRSSRCRRW